MHTSSPLVFSDEVLFTEFNNARITNQFLLVKQMIEGDYERADRTVNELLGLLLNSSLPTPIANLVVYGLLDIFMFYTKHSPYNQKGFSKEWIFTFSEMNTVITSENRTEVQSLLLEFYHRIKEIENTRKNKSKIGEIFDYIGKNFRDPQLTLTSLAETFQLNHTYISNIFKKEYGYNVLEIINSKRVTEAKDLLENTNLSVSKIAKEVGYYSYRTLTTSFKRIEKMTPTEFRELKKNFKLNNCR